MEVLKRGLDRALYWITVVLFTVLVCVVVWQVFTRQVMGAPATWTEEGARLTFVWLGLFGAALVFGERGHIAVEFVVRKFPVRFERIVSVLTQLCVLGFALVILVWGGARAARNAWTQQLSAFDLSIGQMYLALPVAGVLISVYACFHIQAVIRRTEPPYPDVGDPEELAAAEVPSGSAAERPQRREGHPGRDAASGDQPGKES